MSVIPLKADIHQRGLQVPRCACRLARKKVHDDGVSALENELVDDAVLSHGPRDQFNLDVWVA
jgi:hypothetical protein